MLYMYGSLQFGGGVKGFDQRGLFSNTAVITTDECVLYPAGRNELASNYVYKFLSTKS